ncbi:mycothiol S-conjugate amidase [bacterium BMS3Bbin02]|nr:mycothiol S-conjugate amidase [bacterium BMS3Bbin02]
MTSPIVPAANNGTINLPVPASALAIGAHPDDIEFGAGGTLAKWAVAGCRIVMVIVTDGSKGSWDPDQDQDELVATRSAELQAAAAALGAETTVQLGYVDGELEYSMKLRGRICREIRIHTPEVVLSHDPWMRYQLHPDHRATGFAATDGVVAARDHLFFPEQDLPPHRPSAILLWRADQDNHWEDIAGHIDAKVEALLFHSSQGTTTMGGDLTDASRADAFAQRMHEWAERSGKDAGLGQAEAFHRLTP